MINLGGARILVVAPHVDDEVACAGLLHEARKRKAHITVLTLSSCSASVPEGYTVEALRGEWRRSCALLNATGVLHDFPVREFLDRRQEILELLVGVAKRTKPDLVVCPSSADIHQDHHVVYEECCRAFRESTVFGWEPLTIHQMPKLDAYIKIGHQALEQKVLAWRCYESQRFRTYLDDELIRALAIVRGKQIKAESGLAEAYEVVRLR